LTGCAASIKALLEEAVRRLPGPGARLDAEVLLAATLARPRSHLHTWPEHRVAGKSLARFHELLERRARGEPIAYLTGQREFWSLPLTVTPTTLIPRPETETLVELALERIARDAALRIADLGTGCGAVALAVASERPRCEVIANDTSRQALAIARTNAVRLALGNVHLFAGSWCDALAERAFDLILSNPPYVAAQDPHLAQGDVRFEPQAALCAGPAGLDALRAIIAAAPARLETGGWLLVEHGYDQGAAVMRLFQDAGFLDISDHTDDAGLSRVTAGRRPGPQDSARRTGAC
jgi:release factor glutamine methyltransferase